MLLQFTTAQSITNYGSMLLQFAIGALLQFTTTVITIYDRYYNSRQYTRETGFYLNSDSFDSVFQLQWLNPLGLTTKCNDDNSLSTSMQFRNGFLYLN